MIYRSAQEGSLQGQKAIFNNHPLVGYSDVKASMCDQSMLTGSLCILLSDQSGRTLSFAVRLHIALGSSWAIIYLHIGAYLAMDHCAIKAKTTECQTL